MKFVDAEVTHEETIPENLARPPRPARRRVYTSLLVTLSVLGGTIGVIYTIFPNRDSEILTLIMQSHQEPSSSALDKPTGVEIRAWSLGIFDEPAPWPEVNGDLVPESAEVLRLFKRNIAVVHYSFRGKRLTVAFWRARDAPPRVQRREEDGLYAVSWRQKRFTSIAVGPSDSKEWHAVVGAP